MCLDQRYMIQNLKRRGKNGCQRERKPQKLEAYSVGEHCYRFQPQDENGTEENVGRTYFTCIINLVHCSIYKLIPSVSVAPTK